jgi:hypothetical protein
MFAFSGLHFTEGLSGHRHYTYDTPDTADEVLGRGYLTDVQEIFCEGDTLEVNAADRHLVVPVLAPDIRWAPSALLH